MHHPVIDIILFSVFLAARRQQLFDWNFWKIIFIVSKSNRHELHCKYTVVMANSFHSH